MENHTITIAHRSKNENGARARAQERERVSAKHSSTIGISGMGPQLPLLSPPTPSLCPFASTDHVSSSNQLLYNCSWIFCAVLCVRPSVSQSLSQLIIWIHFFRHRAIFCFSSAFLFITTSFLSHLFFWSYFFSSIVRIHLFFSLRPFFLCVVFLFSSSDVVVATKSITDKTAHTRVLTI